MNKLVIIGNLTRNPESRTTSTGISVCNFTVAVNRRKTANGEQQADFFRVNAWRELGINCQKYLSKGKKVCVTGAVYLNNFTGQDGLVRSNLEVTADEVEFLSQRVESGTEEQDENKSANQKPEGEYIQVDEEDLPF